MKLHCYFVVLAAALAALAAFSEAGGKDEKTVWMHKNLLRRSHKPEDNVIDHGPKYRNKGKHHHQKLLGHRGEHWANAADFEAYQKKKHGFLKKKKLQGRQQNDRDDARLQDVAYEKPIFEEQKPSQFFADRKVAKAKKVSKKDRQRAIRREVKKSALKGLQPEKIYQKFDTKEDAKLARKFYKKWFSKYSKKNGGSSSKHEQRKKAARKSVP